MLFAFVILINEVCPDSSSYDWVELYCVEGEVDVSSLALSQFYGDADKISTSSLTLKSEDDPSTPYDDRFLVVYFTKDTALAQQDEVDLVGDVNGNGIREAYQYLSVGGLWTSDELVVLMDPDAEVYYDAVFMSNYDGSINSVKQDKMTSVALAGQWVIAGAEAQQSDCVDISDIKEDYTIGRTSTTDTNTKEDWKLFKKPTPGRPNVITSAGDIELTLNQNILRDMVSATVEVFQESNVYLKLYDASGRLVRVYADGMEVTGKLTIPIKGIDEKGEELPPGLYLLRLEVASPEIGYYSKTRVLVVPPR